MRKALAQWNEIWDFLQFADWSTVKLKLNILESGTKVKQVSLINHERIFLRFELIVCLPVIKNKIRNQTRHRAASIFLQSNQSLKTSDWILWADANSKLCPQNFRSQGSLFLPSYRGGACIFLAGLECDEGHLLWPTRALRSTAVLQPAGSWLELQPTRSAGTPLPGLERLCYG